MEFQLLSPITSMFLSGEALGVGFGVGLGIAMAPINGWGVGVTKGIGSSFPMDVSFEK